MKKDKSSKQQEPKLSDKRLFILERPKLAVALFDVTIAGDQLLVDRLPPGVADAYGEMAQDKADVKPLPVTPEEVFERAKYRDHQGREGFPASGIRGAIREAAVMTNKDVSKASTNRSVTVLGDILPLKFRECVLTDKVGRNSGPTGAPRRVVRPLYLDWSIDFQVRLLLNEISPQQLYSLVVLAGYAIGIGNWSPRTKKGGSFGCWEVTKFQAAEMNEAIAAE